MSVQNGFREMTEPKYHLAILGDLQGPKIRITGFRDGSITLKPGDPFHSGPASQAGCRPPKKASA